MGGEGYNREWDGWMASLTQWTWVWASSGSWWRTGKPGLLQSMGSQRVGHDWVTELNWNGFLCHCSDCVIQWDRRNVTVNLNKELRLEFFTYSLTHFLLKELDNFILILCPKTHYYSHYSSWCLFLSIAKTRLTKFISVWHYLYLPHFLNTQSSSSLTQFSVSFIHTDLNTIYGFGQLTIIPITYFSQ